MEPEIPAPYKTRLGQPKPKQCLAQEYLVFEKRYLAFISLSMASPTFSHIHNIRNKMERCLTILRSLSGLLAAIRFYIWIPRVYQRHGYIRTSQAPC